MLHRSFVRITYCQLSLSLSLSSDLVVSIFLFVSRFSHAFFRLLADLALLNRDWWLSDFPCVSALETKFRDFTDRCDVFLSANRLDQILGKQGSKARDVYASKISLASRIVKVERQVSAVFSWYDLRRILLLLELFRIKCKKLYLISACKRLWIHYTRMN